MSAPASVPIPRAARPRRGDLQYTPPPRRALRRPAEVAGPQPHGAGLGDPCPDAGYALALAKLVAERVVLSGGESLEDALLGVAVLAMARAGSTGRAPSPGDVEVAATVLGLFEAPREPLASWRREMLFDLRLHRHRQRQLVHEVRDCLSAGRLFEPPRRREPAALAAEPPALAAKPAAPPTAPSQPAGPRAA